MKKCLLTVMLALCVSQANAAFIEGVTGADMADMQITAEFANGSSETLTWGPMGSDGVTGGAVSAVWGVVLSGDSFGQIDTSTNTFYGRWVINNTGNVDIVELTLNGMNAGVVFDTEYGDASANGSGAGREMVADSPAVVALYSQNYIDELYSVMSLISRSGVLVGAGSRTAFMTDTDLIATSSTVPAPAGLALLAIGLLGVVRKRYSI